MREAGMTADVISVNAAISACEKGGQCGQASALLRKMRDTGMTVDVISVREGLRMRQGRAMAMPAGGAASQDERSWHGCQYDQLVCAYLSVREVMTIAASPIAASQDARRWHDFKDDQLQCGHLSVREGRDTYVRKWSRPCCCFTRGAKLA